MSDTIRWCFNHNQLADEHSSLGCDPIDQSCDIGDMIPMRAGDQVLYEKHPECDLDTPHKGDCFVQVYPKMKSEKVQTPRQRWGTCCPNDPECEHSFLEADELAEHMDTPIKGKR